MGKAEEKTDTRGAQFQKYDGTDLTSGDTHVIKPGMGAELLGFQGSVESSFDQDDKRRFPKKDFAPRTDKPKGGRKGKMVIDDNDFPAL